MAASIWEFFGFPAGDQSNTARSAISENRCPFIDEICTKRFRDGIVSGVCTIKPVTSSPVICCPIRLYADNYQVLRDISLKAFSIELDLIPGREALQYTVNTGQPCVAVFGKKWGGELRLPQRHGSGGYFVDWVLAKITASGDLDEFVAVEVQTIDTTGNYRNGYEQLRAAGEVVRTTAGLNWENVSKRIIPQLIYKGQVLQREEKCVKGLFFVCPEPVLQRVMSRVGGEGALLRHKYQPASITFVSYDHIASGEYEEGKTITLEEIKSHTTTVYRLQEAFNNVQLPDENVYQDAILQALISGSA